jgi:hypothetical protein
MKLCWDNLEGLVFTKKGNLRNTIKKETYYFKESCRGCKEPFLGLFKNAEYCCYECSAKFKVGEEHPMYGRVHTEDSIKKNRLSNTGKHHTDETKRKMSEMRKGSKHNMYGKHHTEETRRKISKTLKGRFKGKKVSEETKKKISDTRRLKQFRHTEETKLYLSEIRKNGYTSNGIPLYDTYAHQIEWCEEVRHNKEDPNILEVKCTNCRKWYIPNINDVRYRIQVLKGQLGGEYRLYCSDECKHSCRMFHKKPEQLMKEDAVRAGRLSWLELDREVQAELRQLVLERDNHRCTKCGSTENLQCHHILPVAVEPLLSADIDNCITLCIDCHKEAHSQDGCRYGQLRMEVC